ncbi:hypothetical protein KJD10_05485 (plasmid) [Borreliella valaisiana]|uniref:hypothetical protein n=1 Tax=Borreliella valaisiana TaxID=62088 RepID=UPI001F45C018|nr:hypothetical protein [Borreliella valaisiana]WLN25829.1 hypothetical protein KJD10_05300 [Borreliella valaisiana]WLN25847.1 hypothetical protein KJD10_05485 [Borreliella valaisiana]
MAPLPVFMVNMGMMDLKKQKFLLEGRRARKWKRLLLPVEDIFNITQNTMLNCVQFKTKECAFLVKRHYVVFQKFHIFCVRNISSVLKTTILLVYFFYYFERWFF